LLEEWLIRFGVPAALVGSMLEGDLAPLLAGVVVHLGYLGLASAIAACALGLVGADLLWWRIGRRTGARLRATAAWRRVGPTIDRLAERYGPLQIPLARVVYGTRNASMLFWGAQGLPWHRLLLYDAPSCLAWAALLVLLGRGASHGAAGILGEVKRAELWLLGALVAGALLLAVFRLVVRRRLARGT
jgi:membrane protein DedA with SNARE-associated domain